MKPWKAGLRSSSAASAGHGRIRKDTDAAATYVRACARCGCPPVVEVAADLAEQGALVVDLRLCAAEALAAVCSTLREAPGGVKQVVLRDGLVSLGGDPAYRRRVEAQRRRKQPPTLGLAPLRLLTTALTSFLAARGSKLEVLDLAGAPLGAEIPSLLAPLAAALRGCRTRSLRWLGLGGCRLGDRGLALLLPWLAGADNALPRLEALVLAWNGLADVRLIDALLRARARLCFERRAAPLQLLDLSGNPRLVDPSLAAPSRVAPACGRRQSAGGSAPRLGAVAREKAQGRPGALVRSISCSIAEGLPISVLRLKRLGLDDEALTPLLRLLQGETRRCVGSGGSLATASGFCLEEVDLRGNLLSSELQASLCESLQLLNAVRCQVHRPIRDLAWQARTVIDPFSSQQPPAPQRAQSEPGDALEERLLALDLEIAERDAVSWLWLGLFMFDCFTLKHSSSVGQKNGGISDRQQSPWPVAGRGGSAAGLLLLPHSTADGLDILAYATPVCASSHQLAVRRSAEALAEAGHSVLLLEPKAAAAKAAAWRSGTASAGTGNLAVLQIEGLMSDEEFSARFKGGESFQQLSQAVNAQFLPWALPKLRERRFDLAVVDALYPILARELKLPSVHLQCHSDPDAISGAWFHYGLSATVASQRLPEVGRNLRFAMLWLASWLTVGSHQDVRPAGNEDLSWGAYYQDYVKAILLQGSARFALPAEAAAWVADHGSRLGFVGSLTARSDARVPEAELQELQLRLRAAQRWGFALVAFGTKPNPCPLAALEALAEAGLVAIILVESCRGLPEVEVHGHVTPQSRDQAGWLNTPGLKLAVVHGGIHSLLEAVSSGIPVACVPHEGDQWSNCRELQKQRLGWALHPQAEVPEVSALLRFLLGDAATSGGMGAFEGQVTAAAAELRAAGGSG
ncbi:unnamed protein product, partial [Polarella glacialis]